MGRVAGDSPFYTWRLVQASTGLPVSGSDTDIFLPSVTSIIKDSLPKPMLVPWAFREGLRSVVKVFNNEGPEGLAASSEEELVAQMKDFGLSTQRVLDEASERGKFVHDWLDKLGTAQAKGDKNFVSLLEQAVEHIDPFVRQVGAFFTEVQPRVHTTEAKLRSTALMVAGTTDLVWYPTTGELELTDLKSRKSTDVYEGDQEQVVAYGLLWNEMYPDLPIKRYSVLVVSPEGWRLHPLPPAMVEPLQEQFVARRRLWEASVGVKDAKIRARGPRKSRGKAVELPGPEQPTEEEQDG